MSVRVWLPLLLCVSSLASPRSHAQVAAPAAPAPLSVVVWLFSDADAEFLLRIQGQAADLPVVLQPEARDGRGRSSQARLRQAAERAGSHSVVVYREPLDRGSQRLRLLYKGRVLTRELGERAAGDALRASAAVESAAVVLRSAFRALLAGEQLGDGVEEVLQSSEAEVPAPVLRGLWAALSWQLGIDGGSPHAAHAVGLSGGFVGERWLLRLSLLAGIPARLSDAQGTVALSRHQISLAVAWAAVAAPRFRLHLGVAAGFCGYLRSTEEVVDATYEPTPTRLLPAGCLTPQLGLWLRPALRVPLFVELSLGADLPLGRPRLGYADGASFLDGTPLWPVQPVFSLSLLWVRTPRAAASARRPPGSPQPALAARGRDGM